MSAAQGDDKIAFKILVCGACGEGKTSLMLRLVDGKFDAGDQHRMLDIRERIVDGIGGAKIAMVFWDMAGHQNVSNAMPNAFREVEIALVTFDASKAPTEPAAVRNWMGVVKSRSPSAKFLIVGTKCDLAVRARNVDQARDFISARNGIDAALLRECLDQDVHYISARTNEGIDALTDTMLAHLRSAPAIRRDSILKITSAIDRFPNDWKSRQDCSPHHESFPNANATNESCVC